MDEETIAELAALRSEIASLRMELAEAGREMAGGEGADVGLPLVPIGGDGGETQGAFRFEGDRITHCNFYAAHRAVSLSDVEIEEGEADGTWYLNVPHANPGSATVSKTAGQNNDDYTAYKLFKIEDGEVEEDYRGMPFIPIYA